MLASSSVPRALEPCQTQASWVSWCTADGNLLTLKPGMSLKVLQGLSGVFELAVQKALM